MKTFKCIARSSSSAPEHVLPTMFLEGEIYFVTKFSSSLPISKEFVDVSGKFGNRLGGFEKKSQGLLKTRCREYLIIIEKSKECI